jgi:chaperone modulatory protein CbpM
VITLDDLLRQHGNLTIVHVERWVARGLLRPAGDADAWTFEAVDVARVHLLVELTADLGLDDDDTLEVVIGLVDQVHTLRGQLDLLGRALADQPAATREAVAAALARLGGR